jgi:hypothetical protein
MSFSREAHDWEVDIFASFFQVLHSINIRRGSEDSYGGSPPKKACSRSGLFLALACTGKVTFLGKVCGELRLLRGRLILRDRRL